ncbi:hypothetical protein BRADI_1g08236v3 [Brachypodium distachyon]|uniref:Uncharacterized protein n=1 Tax=Brachypodium distachyon TaxID=15368 RepID=A0A2K2DIK7_BRADI|nr:hypothetical protein BRADI_1g08236v3 [Brachypodium distachyon]
MQSEEHPPDRASTTSVPISGVDGAKLEEVAKASTLLAWRRPETCRWKPSSSLFLSFFSFFLFFLPPPPSFPLLLPLPAAATLLHGCLPLSPAAPRRRASPRALHLPSPPRPSRLSRRRAPPLTPRNHRAAQAPRAPPAPLAFPLRLPLHQARRRPTVPLRLAPRRRPRPLVSPATAPSRAPPPPPRLASGASPCSWPRRPPARTSTSPAPPLPVGRARASLPPLLRPRLLLALAASLFCLTGPSSSGLLCCRRPNPSLAPRLRIVSKPASPGRRPSSLLLGPSPPARRPKTSKPVPLCFFLFFFLKLLET